MISTASVTTRRLLAAVVEPTVRKYVESRDGPYRHSLRRVYLPDPHGALLKRKLVTIRASQIR